jgi:hypothetical protein
MIGKLLRAAGQRHVHHPFFALCSSLAAVVLFTAPAAAQSPPYFNEGRRWIGMAQACTAPREWIAEHLFRAAKLPTTLADFCLFTWDPTGRAEAPQPTEVQALFTVSRAQQMTEDVPVLFPSAPTVSPEEAFYGGLRTALRAQVGDASLLSNMPASPGIRVVVIDSAPDASNGHISPGASRHGDTLAHLIEDLVCVPTATGGRKCAAEVTTVLALPWTDRRVVGSSGGYLGTLSDLARAIERAVLTWQNDRTTAPATTPPRLLLNLSLGWEHAPGIADCATGPADSMAPPARAVRQILQQAAGQGALIIAAAGNDSGGPAPRTGLVCPGRYQAVKQDANASQALLIAASGVDYQDHPLETARPLGLTGIAGLGLGGIAWAPGDPVPPQLTGSSVSTAVVSAVSALVWAQQPSWTPGLVTKAVYNGGIDVGPADACPQLLTSCRSHRASVCGALHAAGATSRCTPAAPQPWSSPDLAHEVAVLAADYAHVSESTGTRVLPETIPRYVVPTVQVAPSVFPQPISITCRTCYADMSASSTSGSGYLTIPARGQVLQSPMLVVRLDNGHLDALDLGPSPLAGSTPYLYPLPPDWVVQSAYLTGIEASGYSVTEQIFVQQ